MQPTLECFKKVLLKILWLWTDIGEKNLWQNFKFRVNCHFKIYVFVKKKCFVAYFVWKYSNTKLLDIYTGQSQKFLDKFSKMESIESHKSITN